MSSVISWSPPQQNWNPWTACNIDEGYLATADLEQLSDDLMKDYRERVQTDNVMKEMMSFRQTLPVSAMRREIMDLINDKPVIIIKGNYSLLLIFQLLSTTRLNLRANRLRQDNTNRSVHPGRLHQLWPGCILQHSCNTTEKNQCNQRV